MPRPSKRLCDSICAAVAGGTVFDLRIPVRQHVFACVHGVAGRAGHAAGVVQAAFETPCPDARPCLRRDSPGRVPSCSGTGSPPRPKRASGGKPAPPRARETCRLPGPWQASQPAWSGAERCVRVGLIAMRRFQNHHHVVGGMTAHAGLCTAVRVVGFRQTPLLAAFRFRLALSRPHRKSGRQDPQPAPPFLQISPHHAPYPFSATARARAPPPYRRCGQAHGRPRSFPAITSPSGDRRNRRPFSLPCHPGPDRPPVEPPFCSMWMRASSPA